MEEFMQKLGEAVKRGTTFRVSISRPNKERRVFTPSDHVYIEFSYDRGIDTYHEYITLLVSDVAEWIWDMEEVKHA